MQLDRDQFLEEGYLILRNVIPSKQLEGLRIAYELLVDRQRAKWRRERQPDEPEEGEWVTASQPRLHIQKTPDHIDEQTASAVEIWLHENIHGVSSHLLGVPDAAATEMMMMCNPVRDRGPAFWHRDIHPIDTAPLQGYVDDIIENGPRYVQWNIPLYDDDVLWVKPGTHLRLNTEEEDAYFRESQFRSLPGNVQAQLKAGDGVVYITPILHWGSNYSTVKRRTIHGGFAMDTRYVDLGYTRFLSPENQATFERWAKRSEERQDTTERALRAVLAHDAVAYLSAMDELYPGRGPGGQMLTTVFLCKLALGIELQKRPGTENIPDDLRNKLADDHPMTLNWGPPFAERFSAREAGLLWRHFEDLDAKLRADEEQHCPAFLSGPMDYIFNEMPADFGVDAWMSNWAASETPG